MAQTRTAARRKRQVALGSSTRPPRPGTGVDPAHPVAGQQRDDRPPSIVVRRWPAWTGMVLSLAGLGLAAYLTLVHFQGKAPACPLTGGIVNCGAVVTSQWSSILGVPVPVLGLAFFAGMLGLQTPAAWRSPSRLLRSARLAGCAVGIGMIVWLIYAELFLIGHICVDCTTVHVLTFALFCTTLFGTIATAPEPETY